MVNFKKVMNILKKKPTNTSNNNFAAFQRAFKAAASSRFIDWIFSSRHKINLDLVTELATLIERSRDLAINNEIFRSYLANTQKSVIGAEGFRLQMQIKDSTGNLDEQLNEEIQWAWYDFGRKQNLTVGGNLNDIDLDTLILRTLLVDGQCFIQIINDPESDYGIKFKVIDSLNVDTNRIQIMTKTTNGIYNGVEVDQNYRPVRYWLRQSYDGNYGTGEEYTIPASQIIHIYKPEFVDQIRGFSNIVASMDTLKQLDDYAVAELVAAKVASCQGVFYERNGQTPNGDFLSQNTVKDEDVGTFLSQLNPGMASVVPKGYSVKSVQTNHPNSDFNGFNKSLIKRVASSIGTSYSQINRDYSDCNYSSLKQGNIDEANQIRMLQRFLLENWKQIQFELFLKNYLINNVSSLLKPSNYKNYLRSYRFICRVNPFSDPQKQIIAIEKKLKLGLTSPIAEIEKSGQDVNEVIKDWVKFNELLTQNGLYFNYGDQQQHQSFEDSNELTDQ